MDREQEILEELRAIREEWRIVREGSVQTGQTPSDYLAIIKWFMARVEQLEQERARIPSPEPEPEPITEEPARQVGKLAEPRWAFYSGFRDHARELEALTGKLPDQVAFDDVLQLAGVHDRTYRRHMRDWGLVPPLKRRRGDWPPSRWPQEPRSTPRQLGHSALGHLGSLVVAASIPIVLDMFSDGKLDHVVHACKIAIESVGRHL